MTVVDLADARFARAVERLHKLGPRPLYELLAELAARLLIRAEVEALVDRYARIDSVTLAAGRGDRFASVPLHLVPDQLDAALSHLRDAEAGTGEPLVVHDLGLAAVAVEDARDLLCTPEPWRAE